MYCLDCMLSCLEVNQNLKMIGGGPLNSLNSPVRDWAPFSISLASVGSTTSHSIQFFFYTGLTCKFDHNIKILNIKNPLIFFSLFSTIIF